MSPESFLLVWLGEHHQVLYTVEGRRNPQFGMSLCLSFHQSNSLVLARFCLTIFPELRGLFAPHCREQNRHYRESRGQQFLGFQAIWFPCSCLLISVESHLPTRSKKDTRRRSRSGEDAKKLSFVFEFW